MTIIYRGGTQNGAVNGGVPTLNLSLISGLAENDVVVAACKTSAGTSAAPTEGGWTEITSNLRDWLGIKVMGASPDATATFWDSGLSDDSGASLALAFRNVDTADPLDSVLGDSSSNDPAAVTPDNDNAAIIVISFGLVFDGDPGVITNYTDGPGTAANDVNPVSIHSVYRVLSGGGGVSQNPAAWSGFPNADQSWTIALRAALIPGQPAIKRMGGVRFAGDYRGGGAIKLWRGLILPPRRQLIRA